MSGPRDGDRPQQGLQVATRAIVVDALAKGVGGTLTKNSALTAELGTSAGTIQRTLDMLAEQDVLRTVSRGHLGRRIEALDVGLAWRAASLAPVRVVVSPSGAVEMDVVEELVGEALTDLGIPHTMRHQRGGTPRMLAVREGEHDLTVVSGGTFEGTSAVAGQPWPGPVRTLGPGTYYAPDRLVTVRRALGRAVPGKPLRVAVDRESYDHEALTRAEFPEEDGCSHVDVPFTEVPAYVGAGIVDAGVWHVTRSPIPPEQAGLELVPLGRDEARVLLDELSRATLVAWSGRPENRAVLDALPLGDVSERQRRGFEEERSRAARLALG